MEVYDKKAEEPLVAAVGDKSKDSENAAPRKPPQRMHQKTLLIIFGQLSAALLLTIGHFFFFFRIDKQLVDEVFVSQSWVTAISFLLVTLIRGALTLCVGTSFVQYLWGMLQERYISLRDIERMFSLRTSLLTSLNPQVAWRVPLLFSMGAYLWLLPVALIYPPGALIVSMDAVHSFQNFNMSVLNQTFPQDFDPIGLERTIWASYMENNLPHPYFNVQDSSTAQVLYDNSTDWVLKGTLESYARFVLSSGRISLIQPPRHTRNSSYALEFDAPQISCIESSRNATIYAPFSGLYYDESTNLTTDLRSYDIWNFLANSTVRDRFKINFAQYIGYIPQGKYDLSLDAEDVDTTFGVAAQIHTFACRGFSTVFHVNITNRDGLQDIEYSVNGNRSLRAIGPSFTWTNDNNEFDPQNDDVDYGPSILPRKSPGYQQWATHEVPNYLRAVNAFNVFQLAFGSFAGYLGTWIDLNVTQGVECIKDGWLETNGTQTRRVDLCPLIVSDDPPYEGMGSSDTPRDFSEDDKSAMKRSFSRDMSPIQNSALNTHRFDKSRFNPLTDLNITTTSLNELLANISISFLTQNTFFDNITVDVEDFRNVYHFADKPGFCIPYALCLVLAAMYAIIAFRALRINGLPAADGGFLQVMVTTRGNTEMERLVLEQGPRSVEEIKGELLALKVKLGEVEFSKSVVSGVQEENDEVVRRLAFRTEAEYEAGRRG